MDFEKQKPVNSEYRQNWERIFRQQEERRAERETTYPNGCPILPEGQDREGL